MLITLLFDYCYRNLTRSCADQLIQDAVMYRFLVFHDQDSMTWKDQIAFTESMGDGKAHMETTTINRKVNLKSKIKKSIENIRLRIANIPTKQLSAITF